MDGQGGGIGPAAWELAQRYAAGTGVERDVDKVWKYLPIAAEGDVADAQYFLAKAYDDGDGPYERNESKRDDWLRRARKLGHEKATEWIDAIEKARSDAAMEAVGNLVKKELKSHWDAGVKGGLEEAASGIFDRIPAKETGNAREIPGQCPPRRGCGGRRTRRGGRASR